VALKKVNLDNCEEGIPQTTLREINAFQEIGEHPAIIKLRDVVYETK